jgi:hypothetical protein
MASCGKRAACAGLPHSLTATDGSRELKARDLIRSTAGRLDIVHIAGCVLIQASASAPASCAPHEEPRCLAHWRQLGHQRQTRGAGTCPTSEHGQRVVPKACRPPSHSAGDDQLEAGNAFDLAKRGATSAYYSSRVPQMLTITGTRWWQIRHVVAAKPSTPGPCRKIALTMPPANRHAAASDCRARLKADSFDVIAPRGSIDQIAYSLPYPNVRTRGHRFFIRMPSISTCISRSLMLSFLHHRTIRKRFARSKMGPSWQTRPILSYRPHAAALHCRPSRRRPRTPCACRAKASRGIRLDGTFADRPAAGPSGPQANCPRDPALAHARQSRSAAP